MRKFLINVNGNSYEVEVEEVSDGAPAAAPAAPKAAPAPAPKAAPAAAPAAPAPKAAAPAAVPSGAATVVSPMPGTILSVNVKVGESVKKGQVLCILEAMKMENEIKAKKDCVIKKVNVTELKSVEKNELLLVLD